MDQNREGQTAQRFRRPAAAEEPRRSREPARSVVLALALVAVLAATLIAAGCAGVAPSGGGSPTGSGSAEPASGGRPAGDEVRLVVSQDYGDTVSHDVVVTFEPGCTALQLLAEHATVDTSYGGGFVNAVDGLESTAGSGDDAADWFYWVDGRMGATGAADVELAGGQTVWWDYHRWRGAMFVPAVLQAFPRPWSAGDVTLTGTVAADAVARWAEGQDVTTADRGGLDAVPAGDAVVTATAREVAATPWLRDLLGQGSDLGVFVEVKGDAIWALDRQGDRGERVTAAMVAAPHPSAEHKTLLVVIGDDEAAVTELLDTLGDTLEQRTLVGVCLRDGTLLRLPDGR